MLIFLALGIAQHVQIKYKVVWGEGELFVLYFLLYITNFMKKKKFNGFKK